MKKAKDFLPNELLRYEREKRNWTQEEVAERIGAADYNMVGRWERGSILPTARYRQQLVALFGKSARELGLVREGEVSFWHVPYRQNVFFTGREAILRQVHAALVARNQVEESPLLALSGPRGIGKTQTALEYTYLYGNEYHTVAWLQASSFEELSTDFAAIATVLNLFEQEQEQPVMIQAVKDWLAMMTRWLLIFDDIDDLDMLEAFLPTPVNGHVLLTTQMQMNETRVHTIEIETMDVEEGAYLLLRRAKLLALDKPQSQATEADLTQAKAIVEVVGGLPGILDQVGAYIEETECSLSDYLDLYREHHSELLR